MDFPFVLKSIKNSNKINRTNVSLAVDDIENIYKHLKGMVVLPEAPKNGNLFGRKDGEWVLVPSSSIEPPGILDVDYGTSNNVTSAVQIFTTGVGAGAVTIDLDNSIPINSLVFVSDLANDASLHNITVDAGSSSTILKGDGTPPMQTFTIDSSGQSYTLRKMTPTQWMIIGTNQ